jgi:hypothetical protein
MCPRVYRGMAQVIEITLTEARPSEGAGLVRRARVILLSDERLLAEPGRGLLRHLG